MSRSRGKKQILICRRCFGENILRMSARIVDHVVKGKHGSFLCLCLANFRFVHRLVFHENFMNCKIGCIITCPFRLVYAIFPRERQDCVGLGRSWFWWVNLVARRCHCIASVVQPLYKQVILNQD